MPNYNFKNKKTGEEWEEFFTISGKEQFLKDNADIIQTPSTFNMVGGTGDRIKNDAGWKENLSRIAEASPIFHPLAERHGKSSIKDINTKRVLKKHGVL